ncbi:hypothetical protein CEXT_563531 [Caerostris extrusa]|uniref:Uncharacterized protein n=1 Tax=Caerostris extrusa TaxID=172846 RepID=A0AAV4Y275_CAEEX|nr:hypothetical protein CEXT_563531 [Caerostris extrusa]
MEVYRQSSNRQLLRTDVTSAARYLSLANYSYPLLEPNGAHPKELMKSSRIKKSKAPLCAFPYLHSVVFCGNEWVA